MPFVVLTVSQMRRQGMDGMYQLRLGLDLQGFRRVLLAVSLVEWCNKSTDTKADM